MAATATQPPRKPAVPHTIGSLTFAALTPPAPIAPITTPIPSGKSTTRKNHLEMNPAARPTMAPVEQTTSVRMSNPDKENPPSERNGSARNEGHEDGFDPETDIMHSSVI